MPETTENYQRVPNPKHTESGCDSIRTIAVSEDKGIKGLYCVEHKKIKTFLFDKEKWTMQEAQEWVKERTKQMKKKFITASLDKETGLFVASTDTEDRDGEVLTSEGWEIKNYKSNPVILWAHNNDEPPIATAEKVGMKKIDGKKKLVFKPKFHDITERAREIAKLVQEGIVNTVSVGFLPQERDGKEYTKKELLEISFVPVPSNPEAMRLAFNKGVKEEVVKEVLNVEEQNIQEDLNEVKKGIEDIKKALGDIAESKKAPQTGGTVTKNKEETATAQLQTVRRQGQIMQKAVETLLREIKNERR